MKKIGVFVAAAAFVATITPVVTKVDCVTGYKNFMENITVYIPKVPGSDLASAVQKGLDAYNSCESGDSFSPNGVWDKIESDMKALAAGGDSVDN